jgi:tRNA threonylcarbamoyl adenosine modification protein YjeE
MTHVLEQTGAATFVSGSAQATKALGEVCARYAYEGLLLILTGELGAGKTQFVKGLAAGLGSDACVTSPTFTIGTVYDCARLELFHFDAYRLTSEDELGDAGLLDVCGQEGVSCVEWGEPFANALGAERVDVTFTRALTAGNTSGTVSEAGLEGEPARTIKFVAHGAAAQAFVDAVATAAAKELC